MFGNFSMPELLIVGALALIVIGPKDLPRMMRSVGKFVGQARGMARQFQRSMDDAARDIDLQEFKDAKALMDTKADTKSLTNSLGEKIGFDDDDKPASKLKKPAMSASEMADASKQFEEPKASEPAKPAPAPETATANADPEPAKASQG